MKQLTLVFFLVLTILSVNAQDIKVLSDGNIIEYYSEILQENKDVYISVPKDYDQDSISNFPIVFLTEAEFIFKPFSSIIRTMEEFNEIPKCVVIGLPLENNHLDYAPILKGVPESGNSEKILSFISKELLPSLDSMYGIDYSNTILWTHSGLGGLFGLNTLLSTNTTFSGFILSSPNFKFASDYLDIDNPFENLKKRGNISVYLTCGSMEYETYKPSFESLNEKFEEDSIPNLKIKTQVNIGRNHHTSAYAGLIDGLLFYFNER